MTKFTALAAAVCALVGWSAGDGEAQGRGSNAASERFVVSGVIVFEHEGGLAWMREPSLTGDRVVAVRVAESIGPYRVTRILEDRVELEGPSGTVLVPVYNADVGPGVAVAQAGSDEDAVRARAARRDSVQGVGGGSPTQSSDTALQALRDRLEAAKRVAEQPARDPRRVDPQGDTPPSGAAASSSVANMSTRRQSSGAGASGATSTGASTASPGGTAAAGSGASPAVGPTPVAPGANPAGNSGTTGNSNVVYPTRRDTFQSILGLK